MTKLSKCPECGNEAFVAYADTEAEYQGSCLKCPIVGPETTDCSRDTAIVLWNKFCEEYSKVTGE